MIRALILTAALAIAPTAFAENASPFMPPAPPPPKVVRLLAPAGYFDAGALEAFQDASGYEIAYDAYAGLADLPEKWREGPYDLVVLSGPPLAREIAQGALAKLDKSRIPNARAIQPAIVAKLAAYERAVDYAIPVGWFATGLVYDATAAARRLGGPPASWANLFAPAEARKMADCGIVLPDTRDALFIAAWRLLGVDPAKAKPATVKFVGALIGRARQAARAFPAPDIAGALASGTACLAVGDAGVAEAANERSRESGAAANIRFALPREGGALTLDAFAIPRDAPNSAEAYALLDFLLRPDIAARDASAARLVSALDGGQNDMLKRLSPEGALDPRLDGAVQAEWARLRAGK